MTFRQVALAIALITLLGGCAKERRPSAALFERGDRLVEQGQYTAAISTYDELLATYPNDPAAPRAQAIRDTLSSLMAARADVARLKEELATRDGEVGRLKQEVHRLATETERLRGDLQELKRIDLKQERRRR